MKVLISYSTFLEGLKIDALNIDAHVDRTWSDASLHDSQQSRLDSQVILVELV